MATRNTEKEMIYLKNTQDSIRIWKSFEIKDDLSQGGYQFDGRGYWFKLKKNLTIVELVEEYQWLQGLGVLLLLPDGVSVDDILLAEKSIQGISVLAAQDPRKGVALLKTWKDVKCWFAGPKSVPAPETVF